MGTARPGGQRPWTPEEDAQLLRHYPEEGPNWPGWGTHGVHRTPRAIQARAVAVGCVTRSSKGSWGELEDDQLRLVLNLVSNRLGRTKAAVAARMRELAARDMERDTESDRKEDR